MTSQVAITLLKSLEQSLDSYCELNDEGKTAFRMAIEALSCSENPNNSDCISRQLAIEAIRKLSQDDGYINLPHEHVTDAVRALPSVQPDLSEYSDNIWRNAYERGKRDAQPDFDMTEKIDKAYDDGYEQGYLQGKADYERKTGKWRRRLVDSGFNADWHCSECGWKTSLEEHGYNFCPNCGAYMKEGAENETD